MARALANPRGAAESAWPVALERRPLVDVDLADDEVVGDELVVVLRVGHGRLEKLENVDGRRSWRVPKDGTRVVDRLAADVIHHEPSLPGRMAHVLGLSPHDDRAIGSSRRRRLLVNGSGGLRGTPPRRLGGLLVGSLFGLGLV